MTRGEKVMPPPYSPIPRKLTLANGIKSGKYRYKGGKLLKRCTVCSAYKAANTENFVKATSDASGLSAQCKECKAVQSKRQYKSSSKQVPDADSLGNSLSRLPFFRWNDYLANHNGVMK